MVCMMAFHERCKLSSYERDLGIFLINNRNEINGSVIEYQKLIVYNRMKPSVVKEWVAELLKYKGDTIFLHDIQTWTIPTFPVSGSDLMKSGIPPGKQLGRVIDRLKVMWADSAFKMTSDELITQLPNVLTELGIKKVFE